ncbi:Thioesterase/thiol ester dehydrase-isomerase [Hypoxylon trugodes]|uniref:Thioesterase/thiol ester dehydrase-isomerase n=1 Tax=Hypoxylon trugodes TaxID=326681 RepID=UPI00218FE9F4|nr:Thioesterase/thiol ester dehydrase-isomerase [Hypoxylon trugodes]KAI1387593.1 Thioesterase/thiol ester dehydrase-isomerase [Hypoxylon trugodes]
MAALSPAESLIAVRAAPEVAPDTFINKKPLGLQQNGRSTFGGLLISQAISAANRTVRPDFYVYSSQSSFLRPVRKDSEGEVIYRVERTADGRTYATRLVHAIANGTCVYVAIISFQNDELRAFNALTYSVPMPDVDASPEDVSEEASSHFNEQYAKQSGGVMKPFTPEEKPFDWRPYAFVKEDDPTEVRIRGFVRARPLARNTPPVNLAALAYASDEMLPGVSIYANPDIAGVGGRNVALVASLTHNVSFHDPAVQVDQWMFVERKTTWGADGRVLVHQQMWDLNSRQLVLTTDQEAVIRLRDSKL